jgi:hypothetical protein
MKLSPLPRVAIWLSAGVAFPAALLGAQSDQGAYARSVTAIARRQTVDDSIAAPGALSILLTAAAR